MLPMSMITSTADHPMHRQSPIPLVSKPLPPLRHTRDAAAAPAMPRPAGSGGDGGAGAGR